MKMISSGALAKIKGVTKQAVSKALKEGRLIGRKKGRQYEINLHHRLTKIYLKNMSRQEIDQKLKQVRDKSIIKSKENTKKKHKTKKEKELLSFSKKYEKERNDNIETKRLAELGKLNAATNKLNIEIAEKTKSLIPKDLCNDVFQNMSNIIINYFFTLGERLAPDVTAICKINDSKKQIAVKHRIDEEVQRCIKQFKIEAKLKKDG